jgi:nucleoside-diphosphate-sugar epimerase
MTTATASEDQSRQHETAPHRKTGVLIGGSGLVGGTLLHAFKTRRQENIDVLAPNSKELSIRDPDDVRGYFERVKPDFIINCAIATIDSNPELTFEVNCLGAVYLARAAQDLGITYIHLSSAAFMPSGEDLCEGAVPEPTPEMPNYAKGKLLAEMALRRIGELEDLDYTIIRLAIVYGAHDHKIQGFHRLLFAIVDGAMPLLLTTRNARHSYTNAKKLPRLIAHVLANRSEFSRHTYHFIDPEPVRLAELILTVKAMLGRKTPREIYVPYALARIGVFLLARIARLIRRIGVEARPPAERVFLRNFYESQTLSCARLCNSSYVDPDPEATIFTELPGLIRYYVQRWESLNLVGRAGSGTVEAGNALTEFARSPDQLVSSILAQQERPFLKQCSLIAPEASPEIDLARDVAA